MTYVLARCAPGYSPERVRDDIRRCVPDVDVLTSREFALQSVSYWMLETGAGITVVLTALFGLVIGVFVASQTLAALTHDHLPSYATLVASGSRGDSCCRSSCSRGSYSACAGTWLAAWGSPSPAV